DRRADRKAPDALGQVLSVRARLGSKGDATVAVVRRADRALTGAAQPFLSPRLDRRALDLAAGLRVRAAGTAVCQLSKHRLPDRRPVGRKPEHLVVRLDRLDLFALNVENGKLHSFA